MNDAATGSSAPAPVKQRLGWYITLCVIFLGCAAATFGYIASYPLLRSTAIGFVNFAFCLFIITAPIIFGAALFAPSQQWIAAIKVHASLYFAYVLLLSHKLGPSGGLFGSILLFILLVELVLLVAALGRAPEDACELEGAPLLFSGLTLAVLGGCACGFLVWLAVVRVGILDVTSPAEQQLLRRSSELGPRIPVMHHSR